MRATRVVLGWFVVDGLLPKACCVCLSMALVLRLAGCGGSDRPPFERVHFRATDRTQLEGRVFGDGDVAIVLVHMGRPEDSQANWAGLARTLAERGYLTLTYNRRGVCPRAGAGCSSGSNDYATSWRDVVGAVRFVRDRGAGQVVVVGASIGAMASLHAAALRRIRPAGLVELAGINHASGYDFDRAAIRRIGGLKVFLSARQDVYGGADAAREWFRWATPPKRLELVPGSDHGTDLLRQQSPLRERVTRLIVRAVEEAAG